MTLSRRAFISDAVPSTGLGLRASRRPTGDMPGIKLTQAESDAVTREALPAVADPAAGIFGMGSCNNPATKRPCCSFWKACSSAVIAGEARVCRVQEIRNDSQAVEEAYLAARAVLGERMLAVMRKSEGPLLFVEIITQLGIAADAAACDQARCALAPLRRAGRIEAVGQRMRQSGRSSKPATLWGVVENA